jgi:hypothetical protein
MVAMTLKDWPPQTLETWCAGVDSQPGERYLIENLLPMGSTTIMSGRPKLPKKTWLAMAIAHALRTGQAVSLLKPTGVYPVLFCELEGPPFFVSRRWHAIKAGHPAEPVAPLFFAHRISLVLNDRAWQDKLGTFIAENNIALLVIDTFTKASRGDENDSENVGEILRAFEVIRARAPQCSILFLHHLSKRSTTAVDAEDIDDEIRGSTAIAGGYDAHWALRVSKEDDEVLWLIVRNSNGVTRYFKVKWEIAEAGDPMAKLELTLLCDGTPTPNLVSVCRGKLDAGKTYKPAQLAEIWQLPADLAGKVRRLLTKAGDLRLEARGYRAYLQGGG